LQLNWPCAAPAKKNRPFVSEFVAGYEASTWQGNRVQGQIYVILRFNWPTPPRLMLLEDPDGDLVKRSLPPADANGEVMMVLDENATSDAVFLRMIRDPTSTGSFLL
jgi:hypothetical protein